MIEPALTSAPGVRTARARAGIRASGGVERVPAKRGGWGGRRGSWPVRRTGHPVGRVGLGRGGLVGLFPELQARETREAVGDPGVLGLDTFVADGAWGAELCEGGMGGASRNNTPANEF